MRPSLQPRKQSLQPNKEAVETLQKLHERCNTKSKMATYILGFFKQSKNKEKEFEKKSYLTLENRIKLLNEEKKEIEAVLNKLKERYIEKSISEESYEELSAKYSKQMRSIQSRIDEEKIVSEIESKNVIPSFENILNEIENQFIDKKLNEESYKELREKFQSKIYQHEKNEVVANSSKKGDYGYELAIFGFFMGGWLVLLLSPISVTDLINFFTNNYNRTECFSDIFGNRNCWDLGFIVESKQELAKSAIIRIITGSILGMVISWLAGKHVKK